MKKNQLIEKEDIIEFFEFFFKLADKPVAVKEVYLADAGSDNKYCIEYIAIDDDKDSHKFYFNLPKNVCKKDMVNVLCYVLHDLRKGNISRYTI